MRRLISLAALAASLTLAGCEGRTVESCDAKCNGRDMILYFDSLAGVCQCFETCGTCTKRCAPMAVTTCRLEKGAAICECGQSAGRTP